MPKWFAYMCDDEGMGTGCMDQIWTVVMVAPVTRVHHIRPHKYRNSSKRPCLYTNGNEIIRNMSKNQQKNMKMDAENKSRMNRKQNKNYKVKH